MIEQEKVFVCADDTDDLSIETSTGAIAEQIAMRLFEEFNVRINMGISRHQLWLDDSVPYTSHNSSLCFDIGLKAGSSRQVALIAWDVISRMRARGSNPGLCVYPVPQRDDDTPDPKLADLIAFGQKVKHSYVSPREAVRTASSLPGMILKGGGRTHQGMVGALAGVGLRISGIDGEFRGRFDMTGFSDSRCVPNLSTAGNCILEFARRYDVTPVLTDMSGNPLKPDDKVKLIRESKALLRAGRFTIPCLSGRDGIWTPCTKADLTRSVRTFSCDHFIPDPDEEEHLHDPGNLYCGSCLYRRLTARGYICSAGYGPGREEISRIDLCAL